MARLAGLFYLLTFATGSLALFTRSRLSSASGMIAGSCYVVVTFLFYHLFKPVNRKLSLLAACISLVGCAIGPLSLFVHAFSRINPLAVFGFYCLSIGYLILRSTFLPRALGWLMVLAGIGWLTFFSPALARQLSPFNFLPGLIGEGALTLWLLAAGVNEADWRKQALAIIK
jgi:uncharacterized protein DUF4386